MKIILALLSIGVCLAFSSCATSSMIPKSASEVNFGAGKEGKNGWSSYRENATFRGATVAKVIESAKAGLGDAGFALKRVDLNEGVVIGEHGVTWHDWNVIAGVYIKQSGSDVLVTVFVEGSKDLGVSGDVTGDGWSGKILKGMREYLKISK
ncbi:MAG: hypothetical protein PHV34_05910 [Verrucomicrobiae bacterium]|nr:hypothetical protein [Verrucomicrobiae bacterium]